MKIYLINLERSVDRRSHMIKELEKLIPNVSINRALCVDIKNANWTMPDNIRPGRWSSDRWALSPSDVEIFRSHMDCWKKISKSGQMGIILEDDLLFSNDFGQVIKILENENLTGIVRLDGVNLPLIINKPTKITENITISKIDSIAASAAAYSLDPITATNLLLKAKVVRTVDDYLFDPATVSKGAKGHGLPIYQIEPIITVQAQFGIYSDKSHKIPEFLKLTKRVDVKSRKSRSLSEPILYRFKKEIIRIIYRYRLKSLKKDNINNGGACRVPRLSKDLSWK